jgi:hypothetical protein
MRKTIMLILAGAAMFAVAPAYAQGHKENGARDMMRSLGSGLEGKELDAAIAKAEQYPLGSEKNPVRENQPEGQHRYLSRLRCTDGSRPAFDRAGNVGEGVYGYIVDLYKVTCKGEAPVDVYIDMYHDGPENRPIPGFTIGG